MTLAILQSSDEAYAPNVRLSESNTPFSPIHDEPWGRLVHLTLPGGGNIGVYQPLHERPPAPPPTVSRRAAVVIAAKKPYVGPSIPLSVGGNTMDIAAAASLVFGGLDKLGPSAKETTLSALRELPAAKFRTVVDAGCGTGAQTLLLAGELKRVINAADNNEQFLIEVQSRADALGLGAYVATHCIDLAEIPDQFPDIDLLWSEGAAYNMGFANALKSWSQSIAPSGFAVVSELCWLSEKAPTAVRTFFDDGYPAMTSIEQNTSLAEQAGFRVLNTRVLPDDSWVDGYYDVLGPRATALKSHSDSTVRGFAEGVLEEIDIHRESNGSYGYVLFTLQPTD